MPSQLTLEDIASGSQITGLDASKLTGTLPAINGANLTGIETVTKAASAPSSPVYAGDQWYDTTNNIMKVYNGTAWVNVGTGILNSVEHTATSGQTTFTATYDPGYLNVFLNGIKLDSSDYTATDGASVVLDTGATAGDTLFVQSYDTFALSTHYTKTEADTLLANKSDTSHNHTGTYEPADATILKDADIGTNVLAPTGDGSQLTGISTVTDFASLTDTTVSASDPSVSSNPSATGHIWINKTSGEQFVCTDATSGANVWTNVGDGTGEISPVIATDFLVVAGGGGGARGAGAGGAGGYRNSYNNETSGGNSTSEASLRLSEGTVYTITVGAGGTGSTSDGPDGTSGSDSSISGSDITTITSTAGGGGGGFGTSKPGLAGGSGGGAGGNDAGGSGTAGQGFDGANNNNNGSACGGGGGGASQAGEQARAGDGGDGLASSITGSSVYRAGGGAGGGSNYFPVDPGVGGTGGGGNGGDGHTVHGTAGTANTGGGGGGGGLGHTGSYLSSGGNGGSGVVILRMATADYTGTTTGSPSVSTSGSDTILVYNASGSYTA